jgi:Ca2+-binding RTX toxin-like protein
MTGGNGPDTFVFAANFGNDVITDLKPHVDAIQFDDSVFAKFDDVLAHASPEGPDGLNTVITYANDTITLKDVVLSSLQANDFFFAERSPLLRIQNDPGLVQRLAGYSGAD